MPLKKGPSITGVHFSTAPDCEMYSAHSIRFVRRRKGAVVLRRGDFAIDMGRNIIHGSDSIDSAQKEIALWFKPSELAQYELATEKWTYE